MKWIDIRPVTSLLYRMEQFIDQCDLFLPAPQDKIKIDFKNFKLNKFHLLFLFLLVVFKLTDINHS